MIDGILIFDNEVIDIFASQCSKLMIKNRNNDYHQIFQDTSGDNNLVKLSLCKLDENSMELEETQDHVTNNSRTSSSLNDFKLSPFNFSLSEITWQCFLYSYRYNLIKNLGN